MAVRIRLKRMGSKKRPFYRIIATDSRNPRDGRFIETLGYYDPMKDPAVVEVKEDLVFKWMERGAQPTENTERILRNVGVMKKWSLVKQGVSAEELDAKYEELKSSETPPMDPTERKTKAAAAEPAPEASESAEKAEPAPEPAAEETTVAEPEAAAEPAAAEGDEAKAEASAAESEDEAKKDS